MKGVLKSVMANWRSVMAKRSVMAREECNGHRYNESADKEYTRKATKAAHTSEVSAFP